MTLPTVRLSIAILLFPMLASAGPGDAAKGRALFRSNCAFCHGLTAEGGRGPNLVSAPLEHGGAEADLQRAIRNGLAGTTMPAFTEFSDDEVSNLVTYLRALAEGAVKKAPLVGDPEQGKAVYAKNACASCHRIGPAGSAFGPDLSRIGASRPVEYLRESIVHPSADIQPEFEGVTVVLKDGKRITGVRMNEDTFTVQLRTPMQTFAGFAKKDLRETIDAKESLMPAYPRLPAKDLDNLVAYLSTLRAAMRGSGPAKEAEGVR